MVTENILRKSKCITIRVPQSSRATEFYFPDQPDLRHVKLTALSIIPVTVTPKTYENNNVVNAVLFSNCFITLFDYSGYAFVDKVPIYVFQQIIGADQANLWGVLFNGQTVNWSKSFIHVADASTISIVQDEFFNIVINYEFPSKK